MWVSMMHRIFIKGHCPKGLGGNGVWNALLRAPEGRAQWGDQDKVAFK
ncbi:hypothetical protein MPQ_2378 [Methylovorus sp. MP688]|nr:hypothetical protein MPQ_2378 [Methylovorus sp. MP688]